jgi:hypothetical protein
VPEDAAVCSGRRLAMNYCLLQVWVYTHACAMFLSVLWCILWLDFTFTSDVVCSSQHIVQYRVAMEFVLQRRLLQSVHPCTLRFSKAACTLLVPSHPYTVLLLRRSPAVAQASVAEGTMHIKAQLVLPHVACTLLGTNRCMKRVSAARGTLRAATVGIVHKTEVLPPVLNLVKVPMGSSMS